MHTANDSLQPKTAGNKRCIIRRWIVFAVAIFCSAGSFAQCKPPATLEVAVQRHPGARAYADLGSWYGEHHQFDCADQAFRSGLKLDPASAKLNYFLGLSLYSSGKVEASIDPLQRAMALDAGATQPRLLLAAAFARLGRRDEAEEQWRAVLKRNPASSDALDGLSNTLIDAGDPTAAIELLLTARRHAALELNLTLDLARAYGVAQRLDEAAAALRDALGTDPASLPLTSALATVYVRQKRFQDAQALMKGYLDQHPGNLESQILYLRILVLNENHDAALPLAKKLLVSAPHNFDVLYLNGILERETGQYEQARAHLREAVELDPKDYGAAYNYGAALLQFHDPAAAKAQLEKALQLDGQQAEAHYQLALALRALGETAAAQEQMKSYQELARADKALAEAATKARMAAEKLAAGNAREAASLYREAVADTPQDAMLNYDLAEALRQTGDRDGERTALEQTVKIDSTFALAQNQLGYLIFSGGAYADAEQHFREAVKSAPTFTDAWINLAATLASESRLTEAQDAVASALRLEPTNAQALQLSQDLNAALKR